MRSQCWVALSVRGVSVLGMEKLGEEWKWRKGGRGRGTYEHARHRRIPADDIPWKVALACLEDDVSTASVFETDVDEPVEVALVAPVLVEQLPEDQLTDAGRALGRHVGMLAVPL